MVTFYLSFYRTLSKMRPIADVSVTSGYNVKKTPVVDIRSDTIQTSMLYLVPTGWFYR